MKVRNCNSIVYDANGRNTDFKEVITKHVIELDERFKTIENIVDILEEEHQAKMMEQQKNFEKELKKKLEDQAKASEQQIQHFKEGIG